MEKNILKKRVILYLTIIYALLFIGWLLILAFPNAYVIVWGLFSIIPVIATIITRKITKDKTPLLIKPNFKKNKKIYLFSAFAPGVAIFIGALAFFLLFPNDLDFSGRYIVENYVQYGAPSTLHLTTWNIITIGIGAIIISPFIVPVHIFALGEEVGWRGYLLPLLLQLTSSRKAV